jgi:hypothetical protein
MFNILKASKLLIYSYPVHNLYNIHNFWGVCKQFSDNLVNEQGNMLRPEVVSRSSGLETVSLNPVIKFSGLGSENYISVKMKRI